jgi:hypothetical protein
MIRLPDQVRRFGWKIQRFRRVGNPFPYRVREGLPVIRECSMIWRLDRLLKRLLRTAANLIASRFCIGP